MPELTLEVTEELMGKIEAAAKECLVTPEHFATCKLSQIFRQKEPSRWMPAVVSALKTGAATLETFLAAQSKPAGNGSKEVL